MKKNMVSVAVLFAFVFSLFSVGSLANADEKTPSDEFRVGMEAGYAPFNWSQQTDENNALPIQGQNSYAGGYDVQIAKKVADGLGKKFSRSFWSKDHCSIKYIPLYGDRSDTGCSETTSNG